MSGLEKWAGNAHETRARQDDYAARKRKRQAIIEALASQDGIPFSGITEFSPETVSNLYDFVYTCLQHGVPGTKLTRSTQITTGRVFKRQQWVHEDAGLGWNLYLGQQLSNGGQGTLDYNEIYATADDSYHLHCHGPYPDPLDWDIVNETYLNQSMGKILADNGVKPLSYPGD